MPILLLFRMSRCQCLGRVVYPRSDGSFHPLKQVSGSKKQLSLYKMLLQQLQQSWNQQLNSGFCSCWPSPVALDTYKFLVWSHSCHLGTLSVENIQALRKTRECIIWLWALHFLLKGPWEYYQCVERICLAWGLLHVPVSLPGTLLLDLSTGPMSFSAPSYVLLKCKLLSDASLTPGQGGSHSSFSVPLSCLFQFLALNFWHIEHLFAHLFVVCSFRT